MFLYLFIMFLIYSVIYHNKDYINLFKLLINSYYFNNKHKNIHYLVITSNQFKNPISKILELLDINYDIMIGEENSLLKAASARLKIFQYPKINSYQTILYLDCDILINFDLYSLFDNKLEDKLYALQEPYGRKTHFYFYNDEEYNNIDKSLAFTSAILLFQNTNSIKQLFENILSKINEFIDSQLIAPYCLDQPFNKIVIDNDMLNNQLQKYCVNCSTDRTYLLL